MNIEKVTVTLDVLLNKSDLKRITTYIDKDHKRYIEDMAHRYRTSQYHILYGILEKAMQNSTDPFGD